MGGVDIDSLEYRKYLWNKEYSTRKSLPSSNTFHPSSSLRRFLESHPYISKGSALDIGSGNGRNSIHLSKFGFNYVKGIELSTVGMNIAKIEVEKLLLKDNLELVQGDVGSLLEMETTTYDLVIDMMTLHSLQCESRGKTVTAIKKLLKPNGHYLIFTLLADSPAVKDLTSKMPGPEENSYRFEFEGDIITEKAFTKEELVNMLTPLHLVEYEEYQTVTKAYKGEYPRIYVTALFNKKP